MPTDATTFTLAFVAIFAGITLYLVWLDRHLRRLEARLAAVEAREPGAANPKRGDGTPGDQE
jgi:CcmD family protein